MDIFDNGQGVKDVNVKFVFGSSAKEAKTNDFGRARVSFDQGSGILGATADGYSSQSLYISRPSNCPSPTPSPVVTGRVLGSSTGGRTASASARRSQVLGADTLANTGQANSQVLGATTMAPTGRQDELLGWLMVTAGIIVIGLSGYGYNYLQTPANQTVFS